MLPFIKNSIAHYRELILRETPLPDFKGKHLFIARLRIVVFISAWAMLFIFYPEIWRYSPFVTLIFSIGFLFTAICYWNILQEQMVFAMVLVEILADVASQITIIYVLGLNTWAPFLCFSLYVAGAGVLFGSFAALATAVLTCSVYLLSFVLVHTGALPPFYYPETSVGLINRLGFQPYATLTFLPIVLTFIVYSVRIANFFSIQRQQALERRHIQLTALNNIGSTIRKALNTQNVIEQVLRAVTQGLRFEVSILALVDSAREHLHFYVLEDNFYARRIQEILSVKAPEMELSLYHAEGNAITSAIHRNRVVIRNHFTELVIAMNPNIEINKCVQMQTQLGFKKFVITPLVAEQKGIGAIIGASTREYIEDTVIDTLDNFANQAALAVESSQLFEALEEKNMQLIQANKVKSDFLAMMSHELRTPLIAVIGYSEILLERILGDMNTEQRNSVLEILRNAQNLLELINNILDLSKMESGKMELNLESFELPDLVNDVHSMVKPLLAKKNHGFEVRLSKSLPLMVGDFIKIRQILINLIGNAIKFTEASGVIEVVLEYHELCDQVLELQFATEGESFKFTGKPAFYLVVRDNGIGIEPENLKKVFDMFSQVDSSYTRLHQGTGLGLALTKQLVLLHMGIITVSSIYGQGTEFKILLPQGMMA